MAAKPIIDIDIVITDYGRLPFVEEKLQSIGYKNEGDLGIEDRLAFKRKDDFVPYVEPRIRWIDHHLYVSPLYSRELLRHLLFKEYLLQNQAAREEYLRIKRMVETESGDDRKRYASLKEERAKAFVEEILKKCTQNQSLE